MSDSKSVITLDSLPSSESLSVIEIASVNKDQDDVVVHPLAGYPEEEEFSHLLFRTPKQVYTVGWHPIEEEWEVILQEPASDHPPQYVQITDSETEEVLLDLNAYFEAYDVGTPEGDSEAYTDAVYDFLTDYITYTYQGVDKSPSIVKRSIAHGEDDLDQTQ